MKIQELLIGNVDEQIKRFEYDLFKFKYSFFEDLFYNSKKVITNFFEPIIVLCSKNRLIDELLKPRRDNDVYVCDYEITVFDKNTSRIIHINDLFILSDIDTGKTLIKCSLIPQEQIDEYLKYETRAVLFATRIYNIDFSIQSMQYWSPLIYMNYYDTEQLIGKILRNFDELTEDIIERIEIGSVEQ